MKLHWHGWVAPANFRGFEGETGSKRLRQQANAEIEAMVFKDLLDRGRESHSALVTQ